MSLGQVLLADDELVERGRVVRHLRLLGFVVLQAGTKEEALSLLQRQNVGIVLLELGLEARFDSEAEAKIHPSRLPGLELLEILRSSWVRTPVIILTSLSKPPYEIMAVRSGADAFLRKPVDLNLLTAYIRCKLNLYRLLQERADVIANDEESAAEQRTILTAGDLLIDTKHRLIRVGDAPYQNLSAKEIRLMTVMARLPDKVFSRQELLEKVWGVDAQESYDAVDAMVKRIRRKIEPSKRHYRYLISVHGIGFRLAG